MKAFFCRAYGGPDTLELRELPKPAPKDDEILVRIAATSVNSGDVRVRAARFPKGLGLIAKLALGFTGPRQPILGTELSGIVEAVGSKVTRFQPGDAVLAFPGIKMCCHANYRVLNENQRVFRKPKNLSFEEAATISFGGTTALHFLRKAKLGAGHRILVIGASGAVGVALVQIAAHLGAEVTAVTSERNESLVRSLGAAHVIDYQKEDFSRNGEAYDAIAETVGTTTFGGAKHSLKKGGAFLAIAAGVPDMLATTWSSTVSGKRVIAGSAVESNAAVEQIVEWAAAGALKPVIDRTYDFHEIPDAHAYVDSGRKRGSVVIRVSRELP